MPLPPDFYLYNSFLDSFAGEDLIYGICEAIDAEKDPDCLKLAFHIVESLAQLNPDSSGLLASFAKDVFDILEPYFPIHFTRVSLIFHTYFSVEHLLFIHTDC